MKYKYILQGQYDLKLESSVICDLISIQNTKTSYVQDSFYIITVDCNVSEVARIWYGPGKVPKTIQTLSEFVMNVSRKPDPIQIAYLLIFSLVFSEGKPFRSWT